ncbi:hypothetical protein PybrP1_007427 [[Pythium] brassicae (nom. inval.)]|nr:hypothetical protein PybrP1_007427 [[Pythium] brassicae (nom. inval.)]
MSSFRRKTPPPHTHGDGAAASASSTVPLRGTKPFLNGQALISSGHAQLDALLGGGLLLGTLALLETPPLAASASSAALAADVQRYFCAEGVAAAQRTVIVAQDAAGFAQYQLPLELSLAQSQLRRAHAHADTPADASLTIAWQYAKYIASADAAAQTQPQTQRFCHSFDLARPIHRELLAANPPVLVDVLQLDATAREPQSPRAVYEQLLSRIAAEVAAAAGRVVLRVSVQALGSPLVGAADAAHMAALFAFVRQLRALASGRPVVCVLSGALFAFPPEFAREVHHVCDYVVELKAFAGEQDLLPAELRAFHGLLDVRKLARVHALACHAMDAAKVGLKRERRKLKIEKFHLPPEGSRSSSSSTCGTGGTGSGGHDPLAF